MTSIKGKTAVVTGAGGGIGSAVVHALIGEGAFVIACDVAPAALSALHETLGERAMEMAAFTVDLADRAAVARFAQEAVARHGAPDILVNCAGVYISGAFLDLTQDDWDWVLSANLFGVIHTCHSFLPSMVAHGSGGSIVNLVSMYGYWPSPNVIGYLTSKFGVYGFSEALREDLRPHNIKVATVCPGMINTDLVRNMRVRNATGHEAAVRSNLQHVYARRNFVPERVARAIIKAVQRNKKLVLVSPEAHLMHYLERFCPPLSRMIARRAARRLFEPKDVQ